MFPFAAVSLRPWGLQPQEPVTQPSWPEADVGGGAVAIHPADVPCPAEPHLCSQL